MVTPIRLGTVEGARALARWHIFHFEEPEEEPAMPIERNELDAPGEDYYQALERGRRG